MISKPLTQPTTAIENKTGRRLKAPVIDKYAPMGASESPTPNTK
jgi:hypothetical protein